MSAQQYRDAVETRMRSHGYQVQESSPYGLVGYRRDFRLRWMATTLHLLVHVSTAPRVDAAGLEQYTRAALDHAKATRGEMRGFQSGVAVITAVVGDTVDESAHAFARREIVKGFAAFGWPTVVDLGAGVRTSHVGRPVLGSVYTSWMKRQIDTLLPPPGQD